MKLEGKNIVVTGSSGGIGREIALYAAGEGARVGVNYFKNKKGAEELSEAIKGKGLAAPVLLGFDATRAEEIEAAIELFIKETGALHGWVNNAAINISGLLPALKEEEIREQLDSALLGPMLCARAVIPRMLVNRGGSIVNIGSAVTERAFRGQSVYAAAKGGLAAFTRSAAFEFARKNIRINCIQPGPVETEMTGGVRALGNDEVIGRIPLGRYVGAQGVAAMTAFLLSDEGADVTGALFNIDGGYGL